MWEIIFCAVKLFSFWAEVHTMIVCHNMTLIIPDNPRTISFRNLLLCINCESVFIVFSLFIIASRRKWCETRDSFSSNCSAEIISLLQAWIKWINKEFLHEKKETKSYLNRTSDVKLRSQSYIKYVDNGISILLKKLDNSFLPLRYISIHLQ